MGEDARVSRRTVLQTAAALALAGPALAGCTGSGEPNDDNGDAVAAGSETDFEDRMDGMGNYDGTVADRTGTDDVTVTVGAECRPRTPKGRAFR
jgi:hypothetical protein